MTFCETSQTNCLHSRGFVAASVPGRVDAYCQRGAFGEKLPCFYPNQAFHTEYGSQDTDFTSVNLNNLSIICKLNMEQSSSKSLEKIMKQLNVWQMCYQ